MLYMKTIYHGSDHIIKKPIFNFDGADENTDYGKAIYCTFDKEAGKEWACKKSKRGILNEYEFNNKDLKVLDLTKPPFTVLNWIAILLEHRKIDPHYYSTFKDRFDYLKQFNVDLTKYDYIIGYRADDAYFKFPLMFIEGQLIIEKMEEIYKLGDLGIQIVPYSEKAFEKIKFAKSEDVDEEYHYKYKRRVEEANDRFSNFLAEQDYKNGHTIIDLMRQNDTNK